MVITEAMAIAELTRRGHLGAPKDLGNEVLRKAAGLAMALSQAQLWEVAGMSKPTRKPAKGKSKAAGTAKATPSRGTRLTPMQVACRSHIVDSLGGGPGNEGWSREAYQSQMDLAGIPRKDRGKGKGTFTKSVPSRTDRYAKKHGIVA